MVNCCEIQKEGGKKMDMEKGYGIQRERESERRAGRRERDAGKEMMLEVVYVKDIERFEARGEQGVG